MAQPQPIDVSGMGNVFRNGQENIAQVIEDYLRRPLDLRDIYFEDVAKPRAPSIAILFDGSDNVLRSASDMRRRHYTLNLRYDLWYYHAEMNDSVRRSVVTEKMWEIANVFIKHTTLNCFCPKLGSVVEVVRYRPRMVGNDVIMASALITITAYKLYSEKNAM